jgi:hypothetical protein
VIQGERLPSFIWLRRCGAIVYAGIVVAGAVACERGRPEVVPDLPDDPRNAAPVAVPESSAHWQGEMAGEVTRESVLLQARLSADGKVGFRDVRGRPGIAAFALSTEEDIQTASRTRPTSSSPGSRGADSASGTSTSSAGTGIGNTTRSGPTDSRSSRPGRSSTETRGSDPGPATSTPRIPTPGSPSPTPRTRNPGGS